MCNTAGAQKSLPNPPSFFQENRRETLAGTQVGPLQVTPSNLLAPGAQRIRSPDVHTALHLSLSRFCHCTRV